MVFETIETCISIHFYALTRPDLLKIVLSSSDRNFLTHNNRRKRISRWFGREKEENVARTRSYCGWPSSPPWPYLQIIRNLSDDIYLRKYFALIEYLTPDLPEWAAFGFLYLKTNVYWSLIQQAFTLRICLFIHFYSKCICQQKSI